MAPKQTASFNPKGLLTQVGDGKTILSCRKNQTLFSQGDTADAVFYILEGKITLTVVSKRGKEAVIAILEPASFFGEGCLTGQVLRLEAATALGVAKIVRIGKIAMIRLLQERTQLFQAIYGISLDSQHSHPGGLGRSTLQFQREAPGAGIAVNGPFWERGRAGDGDCENQSENAGRHDRHHPFPGELFPE